MGAGAQGEDGMEEVKACHRCTHFSSGAGRSADSCYYHAKDITSVISGKPEKQGIVDPFFERKPGNDRCGPEGQYFKKATLWKMFWRYPFINPAAWMISTIGGVVTGGILIVIYLLMNRML